MIQRGTCGRPRTKERTRVLIHGLPWRAAVAAGKDVDHQGTWTGEGCRMDRGRTGSRDNVADGLGKPKALSRGSERQRAEDGKPEQART